MDLVQITTIPHPPCRTTLLIIFYPLFLLSILVNPLLTSPGSCTQYLLIPVYPIHNFREFVTGIFSLVTGDAVIRDSSLLDKYQHVIRMNIYAILIQFLRHIISITQSLKLQFKKQQMNELNMIKINIYVIVQNKYTTKKN